MTAPIFPDSDARRFKEDISARESASRGNRPLDWKRIVPLVPFADRDTTTYGPAVYTRDSEGFVWLSGCVKWTALPSVGQIIAVLPVGYRPMVLAPSPPPLLNVATTIVVPPAQLLFDCPSSTATLRLIVGATGAISYDSHYTGTTPVSGNWISLSPIRFYAGPA